MVRGEAVLLGRVAALPGRAREAVIGITSLPACLPACQKHYTHRGGGSRWGLGLRPTGCGSCCFSVSAFNGAVSHAC